MRRRSHLGSDSGVSAVEFGLILPVLLAILLGLIDYGHIYFIQLTITNAAREGARVGATKDTTTDATAAALTAAGTYLDAAGLSWARKKPDLSDAIDATYLAADSTVRVAITLPIGPTKPRPWPIVGFLSDALFPAQLRSEAAMHWELAPEPTGP